MGLLKISRQWLICAALIVAILLAVYVAPQAVAAANPLAGETFYTDPEHNHAARQAAAWLSARPEDAAQLDKISRHPKAYWLGGATTDVRRAAADYAGRAAAAKQLGVVVAYNIPGRDCGQFSAGGAASHLAYRGWIDSLAAGIGTHKIVVILEPDALAQLDCLDAAGRQARLDSLNYAVTTLKRNPATTVYIDIGNKGWLPVESAAKNLGLGGISSADGFSLNVSNFYATNETIEYGRKISNLTGGSHFVVDTSRNGNGWQGEWCNPDGVMLGQAPTTDTSETIVDAFLWVKGPGESDGTCNGGPSAGTWWPEYALELARRTPDQPDAAKVIAPTSRDDQEQPVNWVLWLGGAAVVMAVVALLVYFRRRK